MMNAAVRAYVRRFSIAMTVYVAMVVAASLLSETRLGEGPAIWVIAVLPALPLLYVFYAMGRYLSEQSDEYVKMLEIRKALVATGVTLAVATILGFLEIYAEAPHMPLFFIPVIWFGSLCLGQIVNRFVEGPAE